MSELIRRKDAVKLLKNDMENNGLPLDDEYNIGIDHAICLLACVPTAEPKVGKWKAKSFHECFCNNCGFSFDIMKCDFLGNMKYCPNCGAKME